jgi:hypothetical protein
MVPPLRTIVVSTSVEPKPFDVNGEIFGPPTSFQVTDKLSPSFFQYTETDPVGAGCSISTGPFSSRQTGPERSRARWLRSGWRDSGTELQALPPVELCACSADHADRRVSSGPRPGREVPVLSTTSRSVGWIWPTVTTNAWGADGCSASPAPARTGASSEARNCLPRSVMLQSRSSRSTNLSAKISSFGARAASRRIRSVQSDPLDIRMLT